MGFALFMFSTSPRVSGWLATIRRRMAVVTIAGVLSFVVSKG